MSLLIAVYTTRSGQTSTHWAACLSWTLAENRRVLLVDCDMEGGTLSDLMLLRTDDRGIANCFGDRPASAAELAEQAVSHPRRENLRVVPGLTRSYGYEIGECLRKLGPALVASAEDVVIADLGHPLSHPGVRSPRAAAEAICSWFGRAFVVVRDDPALLSRSIAVLQAARPRHGELVVCEQRGRAYRRAIVDTLRRNLPDLALRDGWQWDELRAGAHGGIGNAGKPGRGGERPQPRSGASPMTVTAGVAAAAFPRLRPAAGDEVPVIRWPEIGAEEREVAQAIADRVIRARGGEPASVLHEERLHDDVAGVINRAIESPSASGLPLSVVSELAGNPRYASVARRNAAILASHLWPLSLLIYGADLENITCLGHDRWLVSLVGRKLALVGNSPFASDEDCVEFFRRAVRLRGVTGDHSITEATPIAEANIGSVVRLCVAKRPAVSGQAAVKAAIRIPARSKVRDLDDYVQAGVMPEGMARFIEACVAARVNLMIAGGTSTGKTTLMRVLCGMVPASEHLVVVEDGAELHLDQDRGDGRSWHDLTTALSTIPSIRAETDSGQLTMFDLVRHALRFQPDRLILGESRGEEMAAVCKALMTGHDGSMTTVHAEDAELALDQAVQYVMENSRFTGNEKMAQRVVEHAIHVVIHMANQDGRRRITGILAVERGGNHKWIYRQSDSGGWQRMTELVGNLHRLGARLRHTLHDDEIPVP